VAVAQVREAQVHGDGLAIGCRRHVGVDEGVRHGAGLAVELAQRVEQAEAGRGVPSLGVVRDEGHEPVRPACVAKQVRAVERVEARRRLGVVEADVVQPGRGHQEVVVSGVDGRQNPSRCICGTLGVQPPVGAPTRCPLDELACGVDVNLHYGLLTGLAPGLPGTPRCILPRKRGHLSTGIVATRRGRSAPSGGRVRAAAALTEGEAGQAGEEQETGAERRNRRIPPPGHHDHR
jgi:hypothetical protein